MLARGRHTVAYGLLPLLASAVWFGGLHVAEQNNKVEGAALAIVFAAAAIPALVALGLAISHAASRSAKVVAAAGVIVAVFVSFWLYILVGMLLLGGSAD
jgi:sulfite exporter TauE/SafE